MNDNTGNGDSVEEIAGYISVALVSAIWGFPEEDIAVDVARFRHHQAIDVAQAARTW